VLIKKYDEGDVVTPQQRMMKQQEERIAALIAKAKKTEIKINKPMEGKSNGKPRTKRKSK
jgi:hypothetical protein